MKSFICAIALSLTVGAQAAEPIKAVVVSGGCCHDYPIQKSIIAEALTSRGTFEISHIGESPEAVKEALSKKGWADAYDVIVYNFCDAKETDVDYIKSVVDVHKEGGKGAVMVHCAMHSYHWKIAPAKNAVKSADDVKGKEWVQLVGVASPGHGPKAAIKVTNTEKGLGHPIMKGIPAEWTTPQGELYRTPFMLDSATILSNGNNGKSEAAVVWINTYGKGKVFSISLGHHNETMKTKEFGNLLANGLLWTIDELK